MVVGIVYIALGMKKVVNYVADTGHHDLGDSLPTVPLVALYGGVVLYLLAHICFRLRNVAQLEPPAAGGVAVLLVVLLPRGCSHCRRWRRSAVLAGLMVGAHRLRGRRKLAEARGQSPGPARRSRGVSRASWPALP